MLGYVGVDDNGLGGLEEKFDAQLHGVPGRMFTAMDARRKVLGSSEREPEPGQNLVLTIDENIQFLAERALDHAMQRTQADNGTVVVQDVHTGQILALAIRPTFNPNHFRYATPALLRNHAVSDVYEPGSTSSWSPTRRRWSSTWPRPTTRSTARAGRSRWRAA